MIHDGMPSSKSATEWKPFSRAKSKLSTGYRWSEKRSWVSWKCKVPESFLWEENTAQNIPLLLPRSLFTHMCVRLCIELILPFLSDRMENIQLVCNASRLPSVAINRLMKNYTWTSFWHYRVYPFTAMFYDFVADAHVSLIA